jgi:hypothetical protein
MRVSVTGVLSLTKANHRVFRTHFVSVSGNYLHMFNTNRLQSTYPLTTTRLSESAKMVNLSTNGLCHSFDIG